MTILLAVAALLALMAVRFHSIDGRTSPDCHYYLLASAGKSVPRPYSGRKLHVWLGRALAVAMRSRTIQSMRLVTTLAMAAFPLCVFGCVYGMTASPGRAFAAAAVLITADAFFGSWVIFPWLADPLATCLGFGAWWAGMAGEPWLAFALFCLCGLAKESTLLVAAAAALASGAPWWVPAGGALLAAAAHLLSRNGPYDPSHEDWIRQPFMSATARKKRMWLAWKSNLGGLGMIPYVAATAMPVASPELQRAAVGAAAVSFALTAFAMDHARIVAQAAPYAAVVAAVAAPSWILWPSLLLSVFWPFETEFA